MDRLVGGSTISIVQIINLKHNLIVKFHLWFSSKLKQVVGVVSRTIVVVVAMHGGVASRFATRDRLDAMLGNKAFLTNSSTTSVDF